MADDTLVELFTQQKSLTEWLDDIHHTQTALIRKEDNEKRERLRVLNEIIGLPFDKPTQFEAIDLRDDNPRVMDLLAQRGEELCAIRLLPKQDTLPKLRIRGKSIRQAYHWFQEQAIDPSNYRVDFVPHDSGDSWATIFIVNTHGIQGEIIYGGHHQLTQGFHDTVAPIVFRYDFHTWHMTVDDADARQHLQTLIRYIYVPHRDTQAQLAQRLGATFTHDYLMGYFETTNPPTGVWYKDYSPSLGALYADAIMRTTTTHMPAIVTGQTGSPGSAQGKVCIVDPDNLPIDFPDNGILVCPITTPNYIPLMQKARAIITDQGGILAHAAIIARELHTPCIVGTGNATSVLADGDVVSVDADAGTVRILSSSRTHTD